ncbi:MAG: hypothetical protein KKB30_07000 [Proteobacteria bacterium]|nr:hypothetical protein [Pseudomonadota bacterium]MBU1714178.1 hypothetical protein [Pseudomonadota bacterium]
MDKRAFSNLANLTSSDICFGLNQETDKLSLALLLQKFADQDLLETLIPRLDETDISTTVDHLTALIHKHLSKKEYHKLFLDESPDDK